MSPLRLDDFNDAWISFNLFENPTELILDKDAPFSNTSQA